MKKKIYKTVCLAHGISIFVLTFTGCEKEPGLYAWYGGKMDVDTVMTIRVDGGEGEKSYDVPFDTYRAVFMHLKSNVADYIMNEDSEYTSLSTDAEKTAAIKEVAEEILTEYYCLVAACEKYGIRITEEDKQQYYENHQQQIQNHVNKIDEEKLDFKGTKEEYAEYLYRSSLAMLGMTPEYYEFTYYRYEQVLFTYTKGDAAAESKARENILSMQEKLQNGMKMSEAVKEYKNDDIYREVYFDLYGKIVGSSYGETLGSFTKDALSALDSGEYSDVMSGDQDDYTAYFVILHKLDIELDYVCSSDMVANLIYQYPYVGASSYSVYYSKYTTILESYVQNSSLTPVSEKVYNRISVKTMF